MRNCFSQPYGTRFWYIIWVARWLWVRWARSQILKTYSFISCLCDDKAVTVLEHHDLHLHMLVMRRFRKRKQENQNTINESSSASRTLRILLIRATPSVTLATLLLMGTMMRACDWKWAFVTTIGGDRRITNCWSYNSKEWVQVRSERHIQMIEATWQQEVF